MTDKVIERIKGFESIIEALEAKVAKLEETKSRKWLTSGKIGTTTIRILDQSSLVNRFAMIVAGKTAFDKARELLGADSDVEFIYENYSYEAWLSDFQYAFDRKKIAAYNYKIAELKAKIAAYTPEELRRDKAFDKMDEEMAELQKLLK